MANHGWVRCPRCNAAVNVTWSDVDRHVLTNPHDDAYTIVSHGYTLRELGRRGRGAWAVWKCKECTHLACVKYQFKHSDYEVLQDLDTP